MVYCRKATKTVGGFSSSRKGSNKPESGVMPMDSTTIELLLILLIIIETKKN